MFTARYGLIPCIKQITVFYKRLGYETFIFAGIRFIFVWTNSICYFTRILSCNRCIASSKASSPASTIVYLLCGKSCVIVQLDAITPYVVTAFYKIKYIYWPPVSLWHHLCEFKNDVIEFQNISGLMGLYTTQGIRGQRTEEQLTQKFATFLQTYCD